MKPFLDQMADFDARRKAAKVTDRELANASGVNVEMISKYRNGHRQPSMDSWVSLNNALDAVIRARHDELGKLRGGRPPQ